VKLGNPIGQYKHVTMLNNLALSIRCNDEDYDIADIVLWEGVKQAIGNGEVSLRRIYRG